MQKSRRLFFNIVSGILAAAAGMVIFFNQRELSQLRKENQELLLRQEKESAESTRESGLIQLMSQVLKKLEDEISKSPTQTASDETIQQVAALSYSFTSNKFLTHDSTTHFPLSTGRGQLLAMLLRMKMDTASVEKIKRP